MSSVVGHVVCQVCGLDANVSESASGTLSILCKNPACRAQSFIKSPGAVTAMKAKLAAAPAPPPVPVPAGEKKKRNFFGEFAK